MIRKPRRPFGQTESWAEAVFWMILALAVGIGGRQAWSGLPALAQILLPADLIAAQAGPEQPSGVVRLPLALPQTSSSYRPVVLMPLASNGVPAWLEERVRIARSGAPSDASQASAANTPPAIALVIDDLGPDVMDSQRALRLPPEVTLAFLPYADATGSLARSAHASGHQVLVHLPMEPDGNADPGPMALMTSLSAQENIRRLIWALARVPGYSGVNNHMGSRFTASRASLVPVMEALADKHVFFLDSMTSPLSEGVNVARAFGVASAGRDVFLDDIETVDAINAQLAETERHARLEGMAIAIGHPHALTLSCIETWIQILRAHGIALVPVSTAIRKKTERSAISGLLSSRT